MPKKRNATFVDYTKIHSLTLFKGDKYRTLNLIVTILLVIVIFAISFLTIYGITKIKAYQDNVSSCQKILDHYSLIGVKKDGHYCEPIGKNTLSLAFGGFNLKTFEQDLEKEKIELEQNIITTKNKNSDLFKQIESLDEVHSISKINYTKGVDNLQQILTLEIENNQEFKETLQYTQHKVDSQLLEADKYIKEFLFLETENFKQLSSQFLDYKKLSQEKRNLKYKEIKTAKQNLIKQLKKDLIQQKIIDKNTSIDEFLKYKYYTDKEFSNLHNILDFNKNTIEKDIIYPITGSSLADQRIIGLAESRGYTKQRVVQTESALASIENEPYQYLQPDAQKAYLNLKEEAKNNGIDIVLVSSFRTPQDQQALFMERFRSLSVQKIGRYYANQEIASGEADQVLNETLTTASPPGYSRHHTGYAVDFKDLDSLVFENSKAFEWVSKNNYLNAKKFGFLPSYPSTEKRTQYGPNPEAWEYIWVGKTLTDINY